MDDVIVGVNYPWRAYGGDFGRTVWGGAHGVGTAMDEVAADLRGIAAARLRVVRWFVFTDARGGVVIDADERPTGIQPEAFEDLDAALGLALDAGVQLVPVLFDHHLAFRAHVHGGQRLGGYGHWLGDVEGHARLIEAVVAPLASRYGTRGTHAALGRAVFAWDLLNEPDWLVAELSPSPRVEAPVPFDVFAAFVRDATGVLRRHDAGRVTLGTARLRHAAWWDDDRLDLDLLQVHAYHDPAYDLDLLRTPWAALGVRRPVVVGECSARGEAAHPASDRPALAPRDLIQAARDLGYAGAWPWSWRGVDAHGPVAPDVFRI